MDSRTIELAFTKGRLRLAKALVVLAFVWPFININYFFPRADFEVNFLPVLLAVAIAPDILAADGTALLLLAGTLAVAASWGSTDAVLRIVIGAIPCLFLLNFQQYCLSHGKELIPASIAYRTLQLFVAFSALQWMDFYLHPVIPGWLTNILTILIPRYSGLPYDEFGMRGVQGWASEPSGAAVVCFSFALVAAKQAPRRRLAIVLLLAVLLVVNKSIYGLLLLAVLALIYLSSFRYKRYSVIAISFCAVGLFYYAGSSTRLDEVIANTLLYGADPTLNIDLARVNQIVFPILAFPRIFRPFTAFGIEMQPLGLMPLLLGYGSVMGLGLYLRLAFFKFPLRRVKSLPLALIALAFLSFVVPSDLVPAIIAFTYAVIPAGELVPTMTWYEKVFRKAQQAYATP